MTDSSCFLFPKSTTNNHADKESCAIVGLECMRTGIPSKALFKRLQLEHSDLNLLLSNNNKNKVTNVGGSVGGSTSSGPLKFCVPVTSHQNGAEDTEEDFSVTLSAPNDGPNDGVPKDGCFFVSLYDPEDEGHINPVHNIMRRDVLEPFIPGVGANGEVLEEDSVDDCATASSSSDVDHRHRRYIGNVGFRCRFCKNVNPTSGRRAIKAAVFPESIEGLYRANIRFMREHFIHCPFIPKHLKDECKALRKLKGLKRGDKEYWKISALRKGLRNAGNRRGIILSHI